MNPQEIDSVATSSAAVVGSAAPIHVISNEVIRPAIIQGGSILRALLTKEDGPSRGATAATSAGASRSTSAGASRSTSADASRFNLLEGLGDDFFDQEPVDDDVIARIIEEIAPSAAVDIVTTASVDNGKTEIAPGAAAAADPRASPLPPTSRSHFSQTSSTPGTKHNLEDHPLSPVLTGRKRKFFGAGKGRKIFKLSREEEGGSSSSSTSSLTSTQLFSQPEHKALVRDYHNFISQVEKQIRLCEQREGEFQTRLTSLTSRREEAEARVRSLLGEEADVRAEYDSHQKQLAKLRRRLVALRGVAE